MEIRFKEAVDALNPFSESTTSTSRESYKSREAYLMDFFRSRGGTGTNLRTSEFLSDLYNEELLTPHAEMREAERMYRSHTYVAAGVNLMTNAILGSDVSVEAEDDRSAQIGSRFIEDNLGSIREAVENMVKTGNGYCEIARASGEPVKLIPMPRPEAMYIVWGEGFKPLYYVYELGYEAAKHHPDASEHTVYSGMGRSKKVKGIRYEPTEILHLKIGVSHVPVYGRSGLCSAVNDSKVLRELERDIAAIARYKVIAKKILNVKDPDGLPVSSEERNAFESYLKSIGDDENIITGGKEIEVQDLSYSGQHYNPIEFIEYIKRKLTATLGPSFYLHGDETTYAVAEAQKQSYYLEIGAIRNQIRQPLNKLLSEKLTVMGFSDDKVDIVFGEFDFPTRKERLQETQKLFQTGLITLNEAREYLELEPVETIGDAFSFELQGQPGGGMAPETVEHLKDALQDDKLNSLSGAELALRTQKTADN